ncbi:serpin family protein [Streptomyces sp. NBC_00272]|uniref:serpin family protein n=1 Tax=Streptomyces sp. NBC_00272 TaxID=2975698 RepID=UPI002E2B108D|nr:serpin family protein [Streptomyces sp. NBC_00272]
MKITTVEAVNQLTTRWARRSATADKGTVLTAAGMWPLLAFLADGAAGPARTELAEALGIPAEAAAGAALELLTGLAGVRGLQAATGLWTRADLPLHEPWLARLPDGARGTLTGDEDTDHKALDAWAEQGTGGLVETMPVTLDAEMPLVLASALGLRLRWAEPFTERPRRTHSEGPWQGRALRGLHRTTRTTSELDRVRVTDGAAGPVTTLEVAGADEVDVHLILGEPHVPPGDVLATGLASVTGGAPSTGAGSLDEGQPGPGLTLRTVDAYAPEPQLHVATVAFSVRAEHDLLAHARLFGLEAATDDEHGHFPGISSTALAVGSARQAATAAFSATGFEAAAVTAVAARYAAGMPPRPKYRARRAELSFERPFGFLAVHRTTRLVLAAGWVSDPLPAPAPRLSGVTSRPWSVRR